jgi:DNA-directed RNA polymerase subunit RPC12/RpoP
VRRLVIKVPRTQPGACAVCGDRILYDGRRISRRTWLNRRVCSDAESERDVALGAVILGWRVSAVSLGPLESFKCATCGRGCARKFLLFARGAAREMIQVDACDADCLRVAVICRVSNDLA